MSDKLKIVKDILKIVISVLIISTLTKSCSKAYTWEEFKEFTNYVEQNGTTLQKAGATNLKLVYNKIQALDLTQYNSFIVAKDSATGTVGVYLYTTGGNLTYNSSNDIRTPNANLAVFYNHNGTYHSQQNNKSFTYQKEENIYGLYENTNTINDWHNLMFQNSWNYINILPRDNLKISNLPWYIADIKIGITNNTSTFGLYYNDTKVGQYQTISSNISSGTLYQFEIISNTGLINGQTYNIKIEDNNGNITNTSEDFILQWENDYTPPNTGDTNTSGDNGTCMCGPYLIEIIDIMSGDILTAIKSNGQQMQGTLQQINSQLQENNKAVQELTKGLLGSGESGEKNFFQKTYEELFTLKSGDVQEIIEEATKELKISSGEISGEMMIINFLQGKPRRFYNIMEKLYTKLKCKRSKSGISKGIYTKWRNKLLSNRKKQSSITQCNDMGKNNNNIFNNKFNNTPRLDNIYVNVRCRNRNLRT